VYEEDPYSSKEAEGKVTEVFEIRASAHFDAAHWLRDYEGPCARMHGHSFRVEAAVAGSQLGPAQLLVDFHDLRRLLEEAIEPLDHNCLNEVEPFTELSPTSENIARHIYRALAERLPRLPDGVRLSWVSVSESPDTKVVYREEA
jgi:6-pyruvoyltetrahydropterin/6-carboxytetrahydropterin synthase